MRAEVADMGKVETIFFCLAVPATVCNATSNHNHTDEAKDEGQPTNNLPHNLNSLLQVLFHLGGKTKKAAEKWPAPTSPKGKYPPANQVVDLLAESKGRCCT
jgi:hypothetical protein